MQAHTRRRFLASSPLLLSFGAAAQQSDSRIEILLNEPIGTIAPEIYSHFVEHLGAVVYDGIWVGENSKIPNVNGLRKALVDALKKSKPSVIRWPGGCFADQYDWRDGIGPKSKRPRRTNFWVDSQEWAATANRKGAQVYDPNTFGTVEFAKFDEPFGGGVVRRHGLFQDPHVFDDAAETERWALGGIRKASNAARQRDP